MTLLLEMLLLKAVIDGIVNCSLIIGCTYDIYAMNVKEKNTVFLVLFLIYYSKLR